MQILNLCLYKFIVGIWLSKCDINERKSLFTKVLKIGKKEKAFGERFLFLWFLERCTTNKEGKIQKNVEKVWEEFPMKYSKNNTSMIVLEGGDMKAPPFENYILRNPFIALSARTDSELVHQFWKYFSKIHESIDIRTFISSF